MTTRHCIGIDLGSTTTKAVVLDEAHRVLGRGITNSRSNYDVACRVAMNEALIHARFSLLRNELRGQGVEADAVEKIMAWYDRSLREQQFRGQLELLGETVGDLAGGDRVVTDEIFEQMALTVGELFAEGAVRKSDFFRDLAGSSYLKLAEDAAKQRSVSFDLLASLFDKAILTVENSLEAVGDFEQHARPALEAMGAPPPSLRRAVEGVLAHPLEQVVSVGTGYGRARLPFPEARIRSEILCHGLGAHHMFPGTRTVLDIGGQDTKAIQVDEDGIVTSFQMNDRCAAGCGRYLGYIADEMNLGLHELGPLAGKSGRKTKINSTCTVFAGAELRERLSLGEKREDILAGLHRAIILRAMSLLARSGGVADEFTFTGGVAKNTEAVKVLRQLISENYGERTINISPDSIYTGALGAALFAWRAAENDASAAPEQGKKEQEELV